MNIQRNVLLKNYSTFGIGGPARFFLEVKDRAEMQDAFVFAKREKCPFFILGKGSNSLFDDRGFNGLVILNKIEFLKEENESFFVGSGYNFSLLGVKTARNGYSGLEFASGIPGTVGGAIFMNAGANGLETSNSVTHVDFMDDEGDVKIYTKNEFFFGYRFSSFQSKKGAIISARFMLQKKTSSRARQIDLVHYRIKTQPYKEKSAGCVFRNDEKISAGKAIEQCGLKGKKIGDAQVSSTHANFIVNKGNAKAQDVIDLVKIIEGEVKEKMGIELKREIRVIPYDISR